tara:strand:- start:4110 stop:5597 length:1488 start_codon:yes stop_codon:yes gene_type:complete
MLDQKQINLFKNEDISKQNVLIDGKWIPPKSETFANCISPIDGKKITSISYGDKTDVDDAVLSARNAFEKGPWPNMSPNERKKILFKIAELIEKKSLELAVLGVKDNGTEINMAIRAEPGSASATFRYYAEALDKVYGEISSSPKDFLGLIHREPIGVIGAIIPWNFPLMIGAWKIAPALASGNTIVLKPSEIASLSLLKLADICLEAGLPPGVLNVVTGEGQIAGQALARHMDVDVITFTGSGNTGRQLLEYSAQSNMKRVYQELGGKSPNIIFADTENLEEAAKVSALGIFRNSGEVCVAGSRLLVQKSIHDKFLSKIIDFTKKFKVGNPLDLENDIGAISSERQLLSDIEFVQNAEKEGGKIQIGGERINIDSGGYYMQPTIISNVNRNMSVFQNEVFGPLLTVTPFEDDDEAIKLANSTSYGLASGIWTSNLSRAHKLIKKIKAGTVYVNTYGGADNTLPLAGVKQSGNGADKSLHAFDKFTDLKSVWIKL